jgi:hypothetical protein
MKLALQGMQFIAPNCCKTHVRASRILKIFPEVIPPDPVQRGGEAREGGRGKEGRDNIEGSGGKEKVRKGREGKDG